MVRRRIVYCLALLGGLVFYWAYREWLSWFLLMLMVLQRQGRDPLKELTPLLSTQNVVALQQEVEATFVGEPVVHYVVDLISATRNHSAIARGASPRATLSVTAMAKAIARLRGRDYVVPRDVQEVFVHTVAHRLLLTSQAEGQGLTSQAVLGEILHAVPAPRLS